MENYNKYIINIFERYTDLKKTNKQEFDNNDLWKIFEYYSCIKLSEEYNKTFYEYDDIDPNFKELNKMSRNDTGIDCSDLLDTIVQCKLRKNTLTWKECSTFFGSQVIFSTELKKPIVRWNNLIITRNNDCILSENLLERKELFIDKPYLKNELITFCENLIINPPKYPVFNEDFKLRDYQMEAITIIKENKKNIIINLPTGTGKNSVIIYSMKTNLKYLILVPRIILLDQLKEEIIKHKPKMKSKIQLIGDGDNIFNENKLITICVFNSVNLIENYCSTFEKIFIDEAHHIYKPSIYYENENEEDNLEDNSEDDSENDLEEYFSDNYSIITENILDDSEDELLNIKNYTKIIKNLVQYKNNVYLSATIDKIDDFEYYSKDIRTMIDLKYLCDYQIHVPIFNDDPTNRNICEHLLKNYRNIIIYCNSQKEGKQLNKLMNELQLNSSEYIDCNTSKKKRNNIIEKYKKGEISFLVNVRILVEGFDAPITKGVCFLHLPTNKTTLIQIIGRCLRLHSTKTIANIILPFSSNEDQKNICNFLRVIAKNDSRIKKSFENKTLGGYISIENVEEIKDEENENIEFKYNMIYDSMGILQNGEEIWIKRLEEVKKYIDENGKKPTSTNKDIKIKQLGWWIGTQQKNYKKKKYIMIIEEIYNKWTEFINDNKYKIYFLSNEDEWFELFNKVKLYIDSNKKRPLQKDKNLEVRILGSWLGNQQQNYKIKKCIMLNEEIYNKWTEFINDDKYKIYFISNEDNWLEIFNKLKKYIDDNNKRPILTEDIKLAYWITDQQKHYKKKEGNMKNEKIYNLWTEFINDDKYKIYFLSNEDAWLEILNKVKLYIDTYNKRPSKDNNDKQIKFLGAWISNQLKNYQNEEQIMKNKEIYNLLTEFINDPVYKVYFLSNEDAWFESFNKVKLYIDTNNKRPTHENKQLAHWITDQQQNYIKKRHIMLLNEEIYNKWTEFINNPVYKVYFQSNEDNWNDIFNKVKLYINNNNKRPSNHDKNLEIKQLGAWLGMQQQNYKNKEHIMVNEEIYNKWSEFINKYKIYFISNEDLWFESFNKVKKYINNNNKRPSSNNKNLEIKTLGSWIVHQSKNYKIKDRIMSNEEIYNEWTKFINDPIYKNYF
jgi:superfamily II DNA or RNA helicase